jgi:hypothetical protein
MSGAAIGLNDECTKVSSRSNTSVFLCTSSGRLVPAGAGRLLAGGVFGSTALVGAFLAFGKGIFGDNTNTGTQQQRSEQRNERRHASQL